MTRQLDTSGGVDLGPLAVLACYGPMTWGHLTPFTHGYIEAMARTFHDRALWGGMRFSDLAPETLARIIADCEGQIGSKGRANKRVNGASFWSMRQRGGCPGFPPLTVTFNDAGKVIFA